MNYQKVILVGNVTKDAKRQTSKKGDIHFTTFSLAVGLMAKTAQPTSRL